MLLIHFIMPFINSSALNFSRQVSGPSFSQSAKVVPAFLSENQK
jgi:hypothetical protein